MTTRMILAVLCAFSLLRLSALAVDPMSFEEISLLLRLREHPNSVLKDIERRKILRPLTPEQVRSLKALGASDALLIEMQRPERIAPQEVATAVELKKQKLKEAQTPQGDSPKADEESSQPGKRSPAAMGEKELIIEKIVIFKDPLHQPFHVFFKASANAERTEAVYHIPGKTFVREGLDSKVEIPVNLVLKGVRENDWATVTLHLDSNGQMVTTANALKRHTARIPITDKPLYTEPFRFDPPQAMFIVSLNTNQEFVYQVFWKIR